MQQAASIIYRHFARPLRGNREIWLCDSETESLEKPMKIAFMTLLLTLTMLLSGCAGKLLERSYSSVVPHNAAYRETEDADTLRAQNYQDLVNTLLILLGEHRDAGVVRIYGDAQDKALLAENACVEVQKETALGAYLLDYITYDGHPESSYYELTVRFAYRHTAEDMAAIVNATSTEALPDLLRAAAEEGRGSVAVRIGYFGTSRAGVLELVSAVHDEFYPPAEETEESGEDAEPPENGAAQWEVLFYPNSVRPGIIEVILNTE